MDNLLKKVLSTVLTSIGYSKKEKEKTVSLIEIQIKNRQHERLQKAIELRNKTPKERWKIVWNSIRKYRRDNLKGYDTEQPFEKILPFSEEEKEQWIKLRVLAIRCLNERQKEPANKIKEFLWRKDELSLQKFILHLQKLEEAEEELKRLDKQNKEVRKGGRCKKRKYKRF
jgi:hypothetical protein